MSRSDLVHQHSISIPSIFCRECEHQEAVIILTKHHMQAAHGITKEEYIRRHPQHKDLAYWGATYNYRKEHDVIVRRALCSPLK